MPLSGSRTNQNKFKAIVLTKTDHNTAGIRLEFSGKTILSSNEIDLLGVTIDTNSHVTKICRKASRQLNAWKRLGFYILLDTRKILANSFIISNFNYCPLVWYFSRAKQLQKIEKIQERILRFLHDDYVSDYLKLLKASVSVSMIVRRMRYLCVEIYKTLNDLNPGYMKDIFQVQQSAYSNRRPCNIKVPRVNQTTFGTRSIRYEGAKIWNHLPNSLKSAETLEIFKVWLNLGKVKLQMQLLQTFSEWVNLKICLRIESPKIKTVILDNVKQDNSSTLQENWAAQTVDFD